MVRSHGPQRPSKWRTTCRALLPGDGDQCANAQAAPDDGLGTDPLAPLSSTAPARRAARPPAGSGTRSGTVARGRIHLVLDHGRPLKGTTRGHARPGGPCVGLRQPGRHHRPVRRTAPPRCTGYSRAATPNTAQTRGSPPCSRRSGRRYRYGEDPSHARHRTPEPVPCTTRGAPVAKLTPVPVEPTTARGRPIPHRQVRGLEAVRALHREWPVALVEWARRSPDGTSIWQDMSMVDNGEKACKGDPPHASSPAGPHHCSRRLPHRPDEGELGRRLPASCASPTEPDRDGNTLATTGSIKA